MKNTAQPCPPRKSRMRVINLFCSLLMHLWCQQAWSPTLIWGGSVDHIPEGTITSTHITPLLKDLWYLPTDNWIKWKLLTITASQVALVVMNPPANAGDIRDWGSMFGSGRSPGGGNGNPLWYSRLENPMDRGAWEATVCGVTKSHNWSNLAHTVYSVYKCLCTCGCSEPWQ